MFLTAGVRVDSHKDPRPRWCKIFKYSDTDVPGIKTLYDVPGEDKRITAVQNTALCWTCSSNKDNFRSNKQKWSKNKLNPLSKCILTACRNYCCTNQLQTLKAQTKDDRLRGRDDLNTITCKNKEMVQDAEKPLSTEATNTELLR